MFTHLPAGTSAGSRMSERHALVLQGMQDYCVECDDTYRRQR